MLSYWFRLQIYKIIAVRQNVTGIIFDISTKHCRSFSLWGLDLFQSLSHLFFYHLLYLWLHLSKFLGDNTLNHHLLICQEVKIVEGCLSHCPLSLCQLLIHTHVDSFTLPNYGKKRDA